MGNEKGDVGAGREGDVNWERMRKELGEMLRWVGNEREGRGLEAGGGWELGENEEGTGEE